MDSKISDIIKQYRTQTFRTTNEQRITTKEQAIKFVNDRGFVYFWPIKGVVLPSLWVAVAGDRPVANAHDDPGHVTWRWKDSLHATSRTFLLPGHSYFPDIPQKALYISESEARQKLSELYFCSVGAARLKDLVRLFRWSRIHVEQSVEELTKQGLIKRCFEAENQPDERFVLTELL